jgi:2-polyprenyl-3-methyl-5-hydroxy-6-metoxy-1,4-benzoquinol methylase
MEDGKIGVIDWENIYPCERSSPRLAYLYCLMFANKDWQLKMIEEAKNRNLIEYNQFRDDIRHRAELFCKQWINHHDIRNEQEKIVRDAKSEYLYNAKWNGVDLERLLDRSKYHVFEELGQERTLKSQIDCQGKFNCLGIERYDLRGKKLLDIGCNAGWFLKEYAKLGAAPIIGIDIEQEWCEVAQEILDNVYGVKGAKVQKTDFFGYIDENIDFIMATSVLHYIEDKKNFFEHALKLMSKSGVLVVEVPVTEDGSDLRVWDLNPKRYIAGRNYLERTAADVGLRLDYFGQSNLSERRVFHFTRRW